jgi:glutathione S-transferase
MSWAEASDGQSRRKAYADAMILFHAGTGPDTQAIGIALEEMMLDYNLAPGRAPVPVTVLGQARMPGANNILMALARRTGKFLASAEDAPPWLAKTPPGLDAIEAQLAGRDFLLEAYTVIDMAMYPLAVRDAAALKARPNAAAWAERLRIRPAVGRGMMVVSDQASPNQVGGTAGPAPPKSRSSSS